MIKYTPTNQLSIEEFLTPFNGSLSIDNKWVNISRIVPWDAFSLKYINRMSSDMGRPGTNPRIVLGALIIKHLTKSTDEQTIKAIQENVYMQYFVGLTEFTITPVFDPSLFVTIRKRIGVELFNQLTGELRLHMLRH